MEKTGYTMRDLWLRASLSIVFVAHNVEEVWVATIQTLNRPTTNLTLLDRIYAPAPFAVATGILSLLVVGLLAHYSRDGRAFRAEVTSVIALALSMNAMSHIGQSVLQQEYTAGAYTSPAMAIVGIALARKQFLGRIHSSKKIFLVTAASLVVIPLSIVLALSVGHALVAAWNFWVYPVLRQS